MTAFSGLRKHEHHKHASPKSECSYLNVGQKWLHALNLTIGEPGSSSRGKKKKTKNKNRHTEKERKKKRKKERQTDRQTESQKDRQTDRQTDRKTDYTHTLATANKVLCTQKVYTIRIVFCVVFQCKKKYHSYCFSKFETSVTTYAKLHTK